MSISRFAIYLIIPAFVAACAQQEEPPVIHGQPIYDKFGGQVGCEEGVYIKGAPMELQCLPPEERCDPQRTLSAYNPNCLPPGRDEDDDDGGNQDPQTPGRGTFN